MRVSSFFIGPWTFRDPQLEDCRTLKWLNTTSCLLNSASCTLKCVSFGTQCAHCILTPLLTFATTDVVSFSSCNGNVKLFVRCTCIETPIQEVNEPPAHYSDEDFRTEALLMSLWTDNIYGGTESLKHTRHDYESWNSGRLVWGGPNVSLKSFSHIVCLQHANNAYLFQIVLAALQVVFWCWGYSCCALHAKFSRKHGEKPCRPISGQAFAI